MDQEDEELGRKLLSAFRKGYPHLAMEVVWEAHARTLGAWTATVREKATGKSVSKGIRRNHVKSIEAALESIPEQFHRAP